MKNPGNSFLGQQIFPGIYATLVNKTVDEEYKKLDAKEVFFSTKDLLIDATLIQIKEEFEKQHERKKGIEDKAKTIFATISISITAITFSLTYQKVAFNSLFTSIPLVLLLLSIIYFIEATIRAMQTINIREYNTYQLDIDADPKKDTITLNSMGDKEKQLKDLIKAKTKNDLIITKIGNFAYAANILVRNGILLFAFYFIVSIAEKYKDGNADKNPVTNISVQLAANDINNLPENNNSRRNTNSKEFRIPSIIKPTINPKKLDSILAIVIYKLKSDTTNTNKLEMDSILTLLKDKGGIVTPEKRVSKFFVWGGFIIQVLIGVILIYFLLSYNSSLKSKMAKIAASLATSLLITGAAKFSIDPSFELTIDHLNFNFNSKCGCEAKNEGAFCLIDSIGPFTPGFDSFQSNQERKLLDLKDSLSINKYSEIFIFGGVDKRQLGKTSAKKFTDNLILAQARANMIEDSINKYLDIIKLIPRPVVSADPHGANYYGTDTIEYSHDRYVVVYGRKIKEYKKNK